MVKHGRYACGYGRLRRNLDQYHSRTGVIGDVSVTGLLKPGHCRIPATKVERVKQDMRTSRRTALNRMDKFTSDLHTKEPDAARTAHKRCWNKSA